MKPNEVTCTVYIKYESKLRKYLADVMPDVVDIGSELGAIGNDIATESDIDTDE